MSGSFEDPDDICACCGRDISRGPTGVSSLYKPGAKSILLCEACFFEEDAFIEESGTNNHPERLARYMSLLAAERAQ